MVEADANDDAYSKAPIHLRNLATDCLRLSMHFFHPIQQCAQQVYHTAVPLSPASSQLRKSYLQTIIENHLSHVTDFVEPPHTWGLLLRTIDVRSRQLTCVTTSGQSIISACEDIMNIYDAVTGVLQQSICIPETATKIQGSPDGSTLVLAHSSSVTMWDVQTGGLIHTFATHSNVNDIAVSKTHIACGLADGSIVFWHGRTKRKGKSFGNGQPVVAIHWLSHQDIVFATWDSLYICDITVGKSSVQFSTPGHIWGMVYSENELLVGASWQIPGADQERYFFIPMSSTGVVLQQKSPYRFYKVRVDGKLQLSLSEEVPRLHGYSGRQLENPTLVHSGQLESPTLVGKEIVCISPATGVAQLFNTSLHSWTKGSLLLGTAKSVAVSLGRNIVVQTNNSIQIFSIDTLRSGGIHEDIHPPHIYPLGKKHVICIQSDRRLILLKLKTMQELHPSNNISPLWSLLTNLSPFGHTQPFTNQSPFAWTSSGHGLIANFNILPVMQAWQSGTPLHNWTDVTGKDAPLCGLSPMCTLTVTVYSSPHPGLCVEDAKNGVMLANLPPEHVDFGTGKVYDLIFDSETRFYLKIDGPGQHMQIPHDITPLPSGRYSHTITRGEPVSLQEPRATPPYTLDANCEWVIDAGSRRICWIPPGNLRRGSGRHFWVGLSLVMVGDDGIVRKLSFNEPNR